MINYKESLIEQLNELDEMISKSERNLSRYKGLPESCIYASKSHGAYQYYLSDTSDAGRKYIKKKDTKTAQRIAQRDYEAKVNKKLKNLRLKLKKFITAYDVNDIDRIYDEMPQGKRKIVEPFNEPEDRFISKWIESHPGMQNTYPQTAGHNLANGIAVRSKSEEIIVNLLEKHSIPYQYEPKLEIKGGKIVYPDFVVLNVRKRKTIYWEHLGIIDDPEYASKSLQKILWYEKSGFRLGDNLIISMETNDVSFDGQSAEDLIKRYLI